MKVMQSPNGRRLDYFPERDTVFEPVVKEIISLIESQIKATQARASTVSDEDALISLASQGRFVTRYTPT